jgi:hypothetical protein
MTAIKIETAKLETALESLLNVDTYDIAAEFEKQLLTRSGLWIGMRLDPLTGAWHHSCEASATTSCDEYFQESGLLSEMTVCSGSTNGTPGPNDGYEWEKSDDGEYWGNDSGDHCTDDDLESFLEEYFSEECGALPGGNDLRELAVSVGLYRFTVGITPVSPDYEYRMKSIQELIDERIAAIESELR